MRTEQEIIEQETKAGHVYLGKLSHPFTSSDWQQVDEWDQKLWKRGSAQRWVYTKDAIYAFEQKKVYQGKRTKKDYVPSGAAA